MMTPENETELAEVIRAAKEPLSIVGGGTRGDVAQGRLVSSSGLSGVRLYEPGSLTIVAGAGTPLAEVEELLSSEGQRLPFEPMDHRALLGTTGSPTIGGVVGANVSGPRRIQAGACRDSLIGVRFVDGSGNIIKNGGRVMKNVTGYDLVKLMAGSYGTLGVISEVAFKVLPDVAAAACVIVDGLSDEQGVAAMSAALGTPYDVSGAAHLPMNEGVTMLRLEGFEEAVAYRAAALADVLARFGDVRIEDNGAKVAALWADVRDVVPFVDGSGDVWRISVKPSNGPQVGACLKAGRVIYDWGGGLVWAQMPEGFDVRGALSEISGHATRVRGVGGDWPRFEPEPAPLAAISAGLRGKFDPRGILNAGTMG